MSVLYQKHRKKLREIGIGFPQDDNEFMQLIEQIVILKPQVFVEIGSREGGSLWMIGQYLPSGATIISIDLAGEAWGWESSKPKKSHVAQLLQEQGFDVHLIEMDSQREETVQQLRHFLRESPIDLLFIDGDHRWEGVLMDWKLYHPLVRPGGAIVFHDVIRSAKTPKVKVWILWDVLKTIFPNKEFIARPERGFGIGILWK